MQGVTFGEKHSYFDWNLLQKSYPVVSPPEPKLKLIEVPGSDAVIDLTEYQTGQVHYEQRKITCQFVLLADAQKQEATHTDILNYLQGKRMNVTLDSDPEYFYCGRAKVSKWEPGHHCANITITAEVEPYKTARYISGKKVL